MQVTTILTVGDDGRVVRLSEQHHPIAYKDRGDPCKVWPVPPIDRLE
jgi:hypothetical protein